jgi:class 3 adenylate cyclase
MRVVRCLAFIDIEGFTAFTEVEGDERAVAMLTAWRSRVRDICSRRAVRIAKWLGDGAMLVAVEATPVMAALLELEFASRRTPELPRIRCGVSVGEVILHEGDDYIGHAVNLAARLCDLAPGGQVLATDAAAEALPSWGAVLSTEEVMLRGLENPLVVSRVGLRPLTGIVDPDPVCGIPLTRLVAATTDRDALGRELWFCSESCHDTFIRRPAPPLDESGSLRTPLIGS